MALRSLVRGAAERVLCALPRRTQPGDRLILAYHNVVPTDWAPCGDRSLHLPVDTFEAQLRVIRNEAEIVPLMELLTTDAPNDRRVAITFDDAYASALALGVGACMAHRAPCTVFVAPGLLGTVPIWDQRANSGTWTAIDREQFLWHQLGRRAASDAPAPRVQVASELLIASADMLRALPRAAGVSFGNHTMTHPNLAALTTDDVRREIDAAWGWLHECLSDAIVPVVAYPYGLAPRDAAGAMPRDYADFGLRVTGNWQRAGAVADPLAFPRWNVPSGISEHGFRVRLRGYLAGR